MLEWVLDWYAADWYAKDGAGCWDCANLTAAAYRVLRGGYWYNDADRLRAAGFRDCSEPYIRMTTSGWRCSRTP